MLGHALNEDGTTRGFLRYGFDLRKLEDDRNVNAAGLILREILQDDVSTQPGRALGGLGHAQRPARADRGAPARRLARGRGDRRLLALRARRGRARSTSSARRAGCSTARASWWRCARAGRFRSTRSATSTPSIRSPATPRCSRSDRSSAGSRTSTTTSTLPLTERYFLGGLGQFQLRGFKARSVGPRRAILRQVPGGNVFAPVGYRAEPPDSATTTAQLLVFGGNGNGLCNQIDDREIDDFDDLDETDVIGGNKFSSATFEYRFPISETIGLQGVAFIDMGNAFDERQWNLFDVTEWRYGTGAGVQWFSPFGPLAVVLGFPLDRLSVEKPTVFEFSIGGSAF